MKKIISLVSAFLIISSCSSPVADYRSTVNNPEYLHRSIKKFTDVIVHDIFSPPVASRIYAYVSVAAYEAARHQDSSSVSLAGQLHELESVPRPETNVDYCFP